MLAGGMRWQRTGTMSESPGPPPCSTASPCTRRASAPPGSASTPRGSRSAPRGSASCPAWTASSAGSGSTRATAPSRTFCRASRSALSAHRPGRRRSRSRSPRSRATGWTAIADIARLVGRVHLHRDLPSLRAVPRPRGPVRLRRRRSPRRPTRRWRSITTRFERTYDEGRPLDLRALLMRLQPEVDPRTRDDARGLHRRGRGGARTGAPPLPRALAGRRRGLCGRVAASRGCTAGRRSAATSCGSPSCRRACAPSRALPPGSPCSCRRGLASRSRSATGTRSSCTRAPSSTPPGSSSCEGAATSRGPCPSCPGVRRPAVVRAARAPPRRREPDERRARIARSGRRQGPDAAGPGVVPAGTT